MPMKKTLLISTLAIWLMATAAFLDAEERLITGTPALPGAPCQTDGHPTWSPQEQWVWKQVCEGRIADFNQAPYYDRILSQEFLETILLYAPYRSALPRHGVRIIGAWFKTPLDLSNANLVHQLWLEASTFDSAVNLRGLRSSRSVSLGGSAFADVNLVEAEIGGQLNMMDATVTGILNMNTLQVDSSLLMHGKAQFAHVNLGGAEIGGQLNMIGATVTGPLEMYNLKIDNDLLMHGKAQFADVNLEGAEIGGKLNMMGATVTGILNMNTLQVDSNLLMDGKAQFAHVNLGGAEIGGLLNMIGATVTGPLEMYNLKIDNDLLMDGKAQFANVNLVEAEIGGELSMIDATVTGFLDMNSLQIDSHLLMRGMAQFGEVNLVEARIGGGLDLSGSTLSVVDLTGAQVHGELRFGWEGHPPTTWHQDAQLILQNTAVGTLQAPEVWPEKVALEGFTYTRLGKDVLAQEAPWFKTWLEKQEPYTPQPYEHLASVLQNAGYREKANEILYASKAREHKALRVSSGKDWWKSGTYWWLMSQRLVIGYGYHSFRVLGWFGGFWILGVVVLRVSGQNRKHNMPFWGSEYSLDMLLPIIELEKRHYEKTIYFKCWLVRWYFYFHKLIGHILTLYLFAGLSGLTK